MGFFSELKEDLSQAVNELMPEEEQEQQSQEQTQKPQEEKAKEAKLPEAKLPEEKRPEAPKPEAPKPEAEALEGISLDAMLQNIDSIQIPMDGGEAAVPEEAVAPKEPEVPDADSIDLQSILESAFAAEVIPEPGKAEEAAAAQEEPEAAPVQEEAVKVQEDTESIAAPEPEQDTGEAVEIHNENKGVDRKMDMQTNREAVDETSIITAGMLISGDVTSEGSVDVIGTVNGNIDILGKLNITGHITGNSKAAEVYAESAKINGEIISEGSVKIGASSVIIGNITATSAAIAGAVKGDIDVRGPVVLDASAIVMGNIKSKSVQINNGAVIEGMCSQCYADISPSAFFDEYKPEPVKKAKAK